jgi:hypothetical protein
MSSRRSAITDAGLTPFVGGGIFFAKLILGNGLINLWCSTYIVQRDLLNLRHDAVLVAIRLRFEGEITEFLKIRGNRQKKNASLDIDLIYNGLIVLL